MPFSRYVCGLGRTKKNCSEHDEIRILHRLHDELWRLQKLFSLTSSLYIGRVIAGCYGNSKQLCTVGCVSYINIFEMYHLNEWTAFL